MNSHATKQLRALLLSKGFEDLFTDLKQGITAQHVQDQTIRDMFGLFLNENINDFYIRDEDDGCRGCW